MPKTRSNGEGSIRKRADGRYEVRITVGIDFATGEAKRISRYVHTQEETKKLLHEMTYFHDIAPQSFSEMTLGEWLDLCLEVYMKNTV